MADVRPFKSCCPAAKLASEVAALPYDVFSRAEAAKEIKLHPHSFLRIDKSTACLSAGINEYAPEVYALAAQTFHQDLQHGVFLAQQDEPAYFAYRLIKDQHVQTGIVACVAVDDYQSGVIKRHENTRAHKQQDRVEHIRAVGAHTGPVLLAYRKQAAIELLVSQTTRASQPVYDFVAPDGVQHIVWRIEQPEQIDALQAAFAQVSTLYIADGHHRAAAAATVANQLLGETTTALTAAHPAAHFLAILFPADQLQIFEYNRIIAGLNGLTAKEFLHRVAQTFCVQSVSTNGLSTYRPEHRGSFGMYVAGHWYKLTLDEATRPSDPVDSLDVAILHQRLIAPVLGISDPRQDDRIAYLGGVRGLEELAKRADAQNGVAFSLYPCSIDELFAVASADCLMPPKSTWFEPKPRSGLFIHCLNTI